MSVGISRDYYSTQNTVVFTNNLNTTATFGMNCWSGGMIYCTTLSSGATAVLEFWVRPTVSSFAANYGWHQLTDSTGAAITATVGAGTAIAIPDAAFAASEIRCVSQGGSATCYMSFKG